MYKLSKTIVLVGLMGAGKTAVGTLVAQRLGVDFIDSDDEIEKAAQMTIAEIFQRDGEEFFRLKESQVLERLLTGTPGVLSTGGGAYINEANRQMISEHGVAVWLNADLELLWARVKGKSTRPLLHGPDPYGTLKSLFAERKPFYALAEITVDAEPNLSKEQMADKVVSKLLDDPQSGVTQVA